MMVLFIAMAFLFGCLVGSQVARHIEHRSVEVRKRCEYEPEHGWATSSLRLEEEPLVLEKFQSPEHARYWVDVIWRRGEGGPWASERVWFQQKTREAWYHRCLWQIAKWEASQHCLRAVNPCSPS